MRRLFIAVAQAVCSPRRWFTASTALHRDDFRRVHRRVRLTEVPWRAPQLVQWLQIERALGYACDSYVTELEAETTSDFTLTLAGV
jgi:hypothetical protein